MKSIKHLSQWFLIFSFVFTIVSCGDDMPVETLAAAEFSIDLDNGPEIVDANKRRTSIIGTDVQASNGVVHVINNVILP